MRVVEDGQALERRVAAVLGGSAPPAVLLARVAEVVADEPVLLVSGDLRPLGFGAYDGQICLVTPTRVVLATATRAAVPEHAFGLEEWHREVAAMPTVFPATPRPPAS